MQELSHDEGRHNQGSSHVVFLIPGIRDLGDDLNRTKTVLEQTIPNIRVVPISYKYFHAPYLFLSRKRKKHAQAIFSSMLSIKEDRSVGKFSIIAHSFGTWIFHLFHEDLLSNSHIKPEKVILCGGILNVDSAKKMIDSLKSKNPDVQILNERGLSDTAPIWAETLSKQFSAIGVWGINAYHADERVVPGGHGTFFTESHIRNYWLPFFANGTVIRGIDENPVPWYLKMLVKPGFRIRDWWWLLALAVLALFFVFLRQQ